MRSKIQKSLFFIGVVAVIITFIMSGILYYQGMQDQHVRELQQVISTAARCISADNRDVDIGHLKDLLKEDRDVHITWLEPDGTVIYDSREGNKEDYLSTPEVQEGFANGSSFSIHKDDNGGPREYYTHVTGDGRTLLRMSSERGVSPGVFANFLPEILLFMLAFSGGCLIIAIKFTNSIIKPLESLDSFIVGLMSGKKDEPIPGGYDELMPLVNKVKEQSAQIEDYLKDIEEDRKTIRIVIDTISDGLIVLNENREILDYNKRIQSIFSLTHNVKYRKISTLYHDEDWLRAIRRAYHDGGTTKYSMTLFNTPYQVSLSSMKLINGQRGLVIALRDQSAAYAAEKMRREFSGNVSHELKTPLTSISGFAEMIFNGMYQSEEDVKHFGRRIYEESHRMLSLVDTLLHLSRLEEKDTTITWTTVDMEEVLRYVADIIGPQARKKNIQIDVTAERVFVHGNQPLLSELALNLLDNAVKYNVENGHIYVKLSHTDDNQMILTVSDTGIGIPKEQQGRVFERFYRAEKSRSKMTGGTGLGLAICKHIVQRHHGQLSMTSEEGKGTTMTVILPAMTVDEVHREENDAQAAREEAARIEQQSAMELLNAGESADKSSETDPQEPEEKNEEKDTETKKKKKKKRKKKKKN